MGQSENDIKKLCKNSKVLKGLALKGHSVSSAKGDIEKWLKSQGVL